MGDIAKLQVLVNQYKMAVQAGQVNRVNQTMIDIIYMVKEIVPTLEDLEARQVATMLLMMA